MNKIILYITFSILIFSSCTNENYLKYDTSLKDKIYIEHYVKNNDATTEAEIETKEQIDSMFYNFGFSDIQEYTYNIRFGIMGTPKPYDREIKITTNNSKYADLNFLPAKADYYSLPQTLVLEKDKTEGVIPVVIKRHKDLELTKAILTIELVANENFNVNGNTEFTITFDDQTPKKPGWWTEYDYGGFTKFKGQLFFKYFWEMENENKYIFDNIVARWGINLDIPPYIYQNNPTVAYSFAFASLVQMKMWNYSQAHPELNLGVSEPMLY